MFKESEKLQEFSDLICLIKRRPNFNIRVSPSLNNNHSIIIEDKNGNYCRLSIFNPLYRNMEGEGYTLSEDDLEDLMLALTENDNESWRLILGEINDELEDYEGIKVIDENSFEIPNYLELIGEVNNDRTSISG